MADHFFYGKGAKSLQTNHHLSNKIRMFGMQFASDAPKITVVIPCFNGAAFIEASVRSVLTQSYRNTECIVVDDCSTDDSMMIISEVAKSDNRVKAISLSTNIGAAGARNAGLEAASGAWISLLDADDLYKPDRLETLLSLALSNQASIVFDDQLISEYPSEKPIANAFGFIKAEASQVTQEFFFEHSKISGRWLSLGYMKPLFTKEFVDTNRIRYDRSLRSGQDFLLYADMLALRPRCFGTNYAGYIYRRRKGSLSYSGGVHLRRHAEISDIILQKHGDKISPRSRFHLKSRKMRLKQYADFHDLRVAVGRKDYLAVLALLGLKPSLLAAASDAIGGRVASYIRNRLG